MCIYIGFTKCLSARKAVHRTHSKNPKKTSKFYTYVREIGFHRLLFEPIIELPIYNRELLSKLERHYYNAYAPTHNYNIPNRTKKEYNKDNFGKITHQKLCNRPSHNERVKANNKLNSEVINSRAKLYYKKNKEAILKKYSTSTPCICGETYRFQFKRKHRATDEHKNGFKIALCQTINKLNLPKYE